MSDTTTAEPPVTAATLRAATAPLPAWAQVAVIIEQADGTLTLAQVVKVTSVPLAVREGPNGPRVNKPRVIIRCRE